MCGCVFGIHVLKIFVERWFWEVNMMFGSLVELHALLHSCLCFSLLEKLFLKASSTPGYLSSFQAFSYRNLDTSSTLGGSIKKVLVPSIASREVVDQSSLNSCVWCFVPRHLYLLMAKSSTLGSTPWSTPLDTFFYRELLRIYIYALRDPVLISSICPHLFISQTLSPSHLTSSSSILRD